MKKKPSKKRSKIPAKKSLSKIAAAPASATSAEVISLPPRTAISMPPPEFLFREAEQEPDLQTLSAYVDSIRVLRDKGFSYREIAHWLSERGVDVDHNAVYRVYADFLSGHDSQLEELREAVEAQEEARQNS